MSRPKRELTRITTNINTNVLEYLDQFAEDKLINRTTAITWLLANQLQQLGYGKEEEKEVSKDV